jgi:hypothetical protein
MTPHEFIAWGLRTTVSKVNRMRITEIQEQWLKAGLPSIWIAASDANEDDCIPLFLLGRIEDKIKPRKPKKSRKQKASKNGNQNQRHR